jgi:hypothetical protein
LKKKKSPKKKKSESSESSSESEAKPRSYSSRQGYGYQYNSKPPPPFPGFQPTLSQRDAQAKALLDLGPTIMQLLRGAGYKKGEIDIGKPKYKELTKSIRHEMTIKITESKDDED